MADHPDPAARRAELEAEIDALKAERQQCMAAGIEFADRFLLDLYLEEMISLVEKEDAS